jgi:superfamily I DNA/RNA helicase
MTIESTFKAIEQDRARCVENIIRSSGLVAAGPGTGKTYLFKQLATESGGRVLAITFINNLADDLARELLDLANTGTFHSFCKGFLHRAPLTDLTNNFRYFPMLSQIVRTDETILLGSSSNIDEAFQKLDESTESIAFFLERGNYYNTVSHNDVVYRAIQIMRALPAMIPSYNLVLVDEYQDFNRLEVELIDILAATNPIVIVGDDDQALYKHKFATPDFLRLKYLDNSYTNFTLPFCSRCPECVVQATNQTLRKAMRAGHLRDRIEKPFSCYIPSKYQEGIDNPKLISVKCSVHRNNAPYMSKYIVHTIKNIVEGGYSPANDPNTYDFLIAGRGDLLKSVYESVRASGLTRIDYKGKSNDNLTYYDCFAELLDCSTSQIGWRALLELERKRIRDRVISLTSDMLRPITDLVPLETKTFFDQILAILNRMKREDEVDIMEQKLLESVFGDSFPDIKARLIPSAEGASGDNCSSDAPRAIATTFMGCKGLSANYVFLVGLNNSILPSDPANPSDDEICQFIVGMTRTRKRCHLLYADRFRGAERVPRSMFLNWISDDLKENILVDRHYFATATP